MAYIDHERAWLQFKAYIVEKPSHGARDLLERMSRIEVECAAPEGQAGFDPSPPFPGATEDPRVLREA